MLKFAFWTTGFIVFAYVALCGMLYWNQERLIFPGVSYSHRGDHTFSIPFEETHLATDGATLNVIRFRTPDPKGVLIYLHGNGDIIARLEPLAIYFVGLGYDVVIPDYRGYGKSSGTITNEADLHADMAVVYQHLLTTDSEESITIYAQSLGTGLAVQLAGANSPKQLFLESPYYSMVNLVRTHVPFIPNFLVKYPLRSDQFVGQISSPVTIIHGDQDTLIPFEQGERLYDLIEAEKEFLPLSGAGHGPLIGDPRLRAFLEERL